MRDSVRFDTTAVAAREATRSQQAYSLIFELQQRAALLQDALAEEERKTTVCNPDDPLYSMLAKSLRARFDNLQKTITSLKAAA